MTDRYDLAVVAPFMGLPSETFVRRHAVEIARRRTLAVVTDMPRPGPDRWGHEVPTLAVEGRRLPSQTWTRIARRAGRLIGRPMGRWRWAPTPEAERRMAAELRAAGISAALVEFLDVWLPAAHTLRETLDRLVVHGHGYDVSSRLTDPWWCQKYAGWLGADTIVVVAEHSRRRLVTLGFPEDKIEVIPCAVEVPEHPRPSPARSDGLVRLLAVGRFVEKKGPLKTLEAFDTARRRMPELRLAMIGDGPLADRARQFVDERGLGEAVDLQGVRSPEEVQRELARADIFVQHSLTVPATGEEEGLPVAILEAMAAAVPVISTRHAGIPEAVVEGETGLLVDEADVAGMADAIIELARDERARTAYATAAWRRARDRFSAGQEVAELRRVLGLPGPEASS